MTRSRIRIPGYRILGEVASGASATVFRAVQENLQREVAIKLLSGALHNSSETKARFMREVTLQASLTHSSILALYDFGVVRGISYLVTELVEAGSLRDLLSKSGALPVEEAIRIATAIAEGLAFAHAAGIIHRDLKPENVLITRTGDVKIADFGLARSDEKTGAFKTGEGQILGTPGYLAPEVIEGGVAGPAADIYALGVLLFEMLTGSRPWRGKELSGVIRAQLSGAHEPIGRLRPGTPAGLAQLVEDCLQRAPAARAASAAYVVEQLSLLHGAKDALPALATVRGPAVATMAAGDASELGLQRSSRPRRGSDLALTRVASQAESSGASAPSGRRFPSLVSALVACLAGLLMLYLGNRAFSPAPIRQQLSVNTQPSVRLPSMKVTVGTTEAVVWFSEPAPPRLRLTLTAARSSGPVTSTARMSATEQTLDSLQPDTDYSVELGLEGARQSVTFRTLPAMDGMPGAASLDRGHSVQLEGISTCVRGPILSVAWCYAVSQATAVAFRESPDRGATWGPIHEVTELSERASDPVLMPVAGGLLLAYHGGLGGAKRYRISWRYRKEPSAVWKLQGSIDATGWPHPVLSAGEEGPAEAMFEDQASETPLRWSILKTSAAAHTGSLPLPPLPSVGSLSALVRTGTRRLVLARSLMPDGVTSGLFWTARENAELPWQAWKALTGLDEQLGKTDTLCSLVVAGRAVIAYTASNLLRVRQSQNGLVPLGPAVELSRNNAGQRIQTIGSLLTITKDEAMEGDRAYYPAIAASGSSLYVAAHHGVLQPTASAFKEHLLLVYHSPDGARWKQHLEVQLPNRAFRELRLAAFPDRLVWIGNCRALGLMAKRLPLR